MNHWFLCARDVMWLLVALFPIAMAYDSGEMQSRDSNKAQNTILIAASFQCLLLGLLYFQVIQ